MADASSHAGRFYAAAVIVGALVIGYIVTARPAPVLNDPAFDRVTIDESKIESGAFPSVIVTEPQALMALENRGFSLGSVIGAKGESTWDLSERKSFRAITDRIARDLEELDARPGIGGEKSPNHAFKVSWLDDKRARFELIGVVNRIDRTFAEPDSCGEVRLVYRLSLSPEGRPSTRLPMTLSVLKVQTKIEEGDCADVANAWKTLPTSGKARVDGITAILSRAAKEQRIEINLQNVHGPSIRRDEDDHAEYLMRSFDFDPAADAIKIHPLLNTPRPPTNDHERDVLAAWILSNVRGIDEGTARLPDEMCDERAVSVAPRGLVRRKNKLFSNIFEEQEGRFAKLPYESMKLIRSARGLLRRLDEGTCQGCHETRAVAGFHLLGETREPGRTFNAIEVGESAHLLGELAWRTAVNEVAAKHVEYTIPRPFGERANIPSAGAWGSACGLGDPTFASWTCNAGLTCRGERDAEVGHCTTDGPPREGDACEHVNVTYQDSPDGDRVIPTTRESCFVDHADAGTAGCSPNAYGFPGGLCSVVCTDPGKITDDSICADIPAAGYESDCFPTDVPIEECLKTHFARRAVRLCSATKMCREDYACARVPGAPPGIGACVPPYFVFQVRVDGPRLDR